VKKGIQSRKAVYAQNIFVFSEDDDEDEEQGVDLADAS
jgi:hypothetical protein